MPSKQGASYDQTFDARGKSYDEAMREFPHARRMEFETLLETACINDGDRICDFPAGGGYLGGYVAESVDLTCLETSQAFFDLCLAIGRGTAVMTTENLIPFPDGHFDKIVTLAGLHHNFDQAGFYKECFRALKHGGRLCVADVHEDSPVAGFLNEFVDRFTQDGHDGLFLNSSSIRDIESAGFSVMCHELKRYPWIFDSQDQMISFCAKLFDLREASRKDVLDGISSYLGFTGNSGGGVLMNWELYFITANKPGL